MQQEWISLNEFMRRNHIGYDTALKLINSGQIEYEKLGIQYKIKVYKNELINQSIENLIRENEQLKSYIKTIQNITNQVEI
ncbi:MAG: hypothetical protein HFJ59_00345 [Clostridia bacterium]|nr:hypothetical protein [Clostridia bacterium]